MTWSELKTYFTGTPTASTAPVGTNSNRIATTAFVKAENEATAYELGNSLIGAGTLADPLEAIKTARFNDKTADYTLVLSDSGKHITIDSASPNSLTIPLNSSEAFPVGTEIDVSQLGTGQTSIVATGGVTILSSGGKLKITGQYSKARLYKRATDTWLLAGDIVT